MATPKKKSTTRKTTSVRSVWKRLPLRKRTRVVAQPLPGYFSFTKEVFARLWMDRTLFLRLFIATIIATAILFGATQQDQYVTTTNALKEYADTVADKGFSSTVQFGILLSTAATGGLNTTLSETQRVYFFLFYLLITLTTVWLLRHRMAGREVLVRDGLYNAGTPVISSLVLFFVAMVQLLPMALGIVVYSAAKSSGILSGWLETGLFAGGAFALSVLSLYWISSTFFAFVVATNPGTYPFAALKVAKKIVAGRRFKLILRLVWLTAILVVLWALVLIPAVMLDSWLAQPLLPIVVLSIQILMATSVIFAATYIYLLYRKMIDDGTAN